MTIAVKRSPRARCSGRDNRPLDVTRRFIISDDRSSMDPTYGSFEAVKRVLRPLASLLRRPVEQSTPLTRSVIARK